MDKRLDKRFELLSTQMKATSFTASPKSNSQPPPKNEDGPTHYPTEMSKNAHKLLRKQANMEDCAKEGEKKVQAPAPSRSQTPEMVKKKKKKQEAGKLQTFPKTHPEAGKDRTLSEAMGRSQNAEKLQRKDNVGSQLDQSSQFRGGPRGRWQGFRGGRGRGRGRGGNRQ